MSTKVSNMFTKNVDDEIKQNCVYLIKEEPNFQIIIKNMADIPKRLLTEAILQLLVDSY